MIDSSITSDEVNSGRPHPDMIFRCMEEFNVRNPEAVIKVGDTPVDIQEGRNAGVGAVFSMTNGTHTRAQLLQHQPDFLLASMDDFPQLFKTLYDNM